MCPQATISKRPKIFVYFFMLQSILSGVNSFSLELLLSFFCFFFNIACHVKKKKKKKKKKKLSSNSKENEFTPDNIDCNIKK